MFKNLQIQIKTTTIMTIFFFFKLKLHFELLKKCPLFHNLSEDLKIILRDGDTSFCHLSSNTFRLYKTD